MMTIYVHEIKEKEAVYSEENVASDPMCNDQIKITSSGSGATVSTNCTVYFTASLGKEVS